MRLHPPTCPPDTRAAAHPRRSGPPGTNYQVMKKVRGHQDTHLGSTRPLTATWRRRGSCQHCVCASPLLLLLLLLLQAFDEGWGGVICKTLSLDSKKVINITPRYAKLRDSNGKVFGWQVCVHSGRAEAHRNRCVHV